MKKIPMPRKYDSVETLDMKRMFGTVVSTKDRKHVVVEWHDKTKPYKKTEKIENLGLVSRPSYSQKLKMRRVS